MIVPLPFGCLGDILGSGSVYPIQLSILMTFGKQLELSEVLVLEAGKISEGLCFCHCGNTVSGPYPYALPDTLWLGIYTIG